MKPLTDAMVAVMRKAERKGIIPNDGGTIGSCRELEKRGLMFRYVEIHDPTWYLNAAGLAALREIEQKSKARWENTCPDES